MSVVGSFGPQFGRVLASVLALGAVLASVIAAIAPAGATPALRLGRDLPSMACNGHGHAGVSDANPTLTLLPIATGTIRHFPELGVLDRAPVGGDIQSTYARTTQANREFRRGFAEFSIPQIQGRVVSAVLRISEGGGWSSVAMPPDTHVLSVYPADLSVDVSDYDRPTRRLGCFDTDVNVPQERVAFDVRLLIQSYEGEDLGFRFQLRADPGYQGMGFLGADFQTNFQGEPLRIEIVTAL